MIGFEVREETDWGNGTAVIVELDEGGHDDCRLMANLIRELLKQNLDKIEEIKKMREY